ncbi:hypothetical protein bcgnr5369_10250 [Bacillus cereus]
MNLVEFPFQVLSKKYIETVLDKTIGEDFINNILNNDDYFVFIHVADTHNGYSGNASRYNEYSALRVDKKNEFDVNVRQDDIDKALAQVIDIAIAYKVDAVLHAGDGTDSWGYKKAYVLKTYMNQIERLNPHGIKYVEIVGNHNLPTESATGTYLEIIGKLPEVYTAYRGIYEAVELPEHNVVVHCAPSSYDQDAMNESLDAIAPVEGKINIGMTHLGVTTIPHYAEHSENTLVTHLDKLINGKMDYFCLGDYHKATDFGHNIRYSGSTDRLGFGEVDNKPQIIMVAIHKKTKDVITRDIPLKVRPMYDLKEINAAEKTLEEVNKLIIERLQSKDLFGAIVRLRISNLPKEYKLGIDVDSVKELTQDCLYFKLDLKNKTEKSIGTRTSKDNENKFEGVLAGFLTFMKRVEDDGTFDKEKLTKIGYERLAEMYEKNNS